MPSIQPILSRGLYRARRSEGPADIARVQALRTRCFQVEGLNFDPFDELCEHVLVEDRASGDLVCCFRLMVLTSVQDMGHSYSAQYYDLTGFHASCSSVAEVGRFCVHPDWADPDVLRIAWGAMTVLVDRLGIEVLFGCSSFSGTRTELYLDAFALLKQRHLAPIHWLPGVKASEVFRFATQLMLEPDASQAMQQMPPLLRTYLFMGGWVSDHAVIDHQMNTLHVFTVLEIQRIPETRKRLLRTVAGVS